MRTFINNIISLAVYDCLLYELQDLFDSMKVLQISRDDKQLLEALANEPNETRKRRADLEQQQQDLQEALAKCKKQFPDINIYMMQNDDRYDTSIAARPSVNVPPPQLNVLTPPSSSRNSSVSIPSTHPSSPTTPSFPGTLPASSKNPDVNASVPGKHPRKENGKV
jgi:type IV secretory pathway VirJ component